MLFSPTFAFSMHVVVSAATAGEWAPASNGINPAFTQQNGRMKVSFHVGGIGMLSTAFSLTKLIWEEKPDLIIQVGIAGTFDPKVELGSVLIISEEHIGDLGVQENGTWKDVFDMNLENINRSPFEAGKLPNLWLKDYNLLQLPEVAAITINEISTAPGRIRQLREKYNPVIESMEGAALHYVCRETNTPFIQMRSVSNYVGERDKANWRIKDAIVNLNKALFEYIDELNKKS
jgi:futalosine hydrolase